MARELPGFVYGLEAAGDLSASQYRFVKVDSNGRVAQVAAAGTDHDGVLQNDPPVLGAGAEIMETGLSKVVVGVGGSTRGLLASIDATGRAVLATTDESVGRFLDTVAVGEIATLKLRNRKSGRLYVGGTGVNEQVLAGTKTLVVTDAMFQRLDAAGANRDVNLPAEALSQGLPFLITNLAAGAFNLVVKEDGGATIVTLNQNESAWLICDGTTWRHGGVITIAQT